MDKEMRKTHWIIGFIFFIIVMLASGCKNIEWTDNSDLMDDFRYLPRIFSGGDPRILTAQETKSMTNLRLARTGLISMSEYNARVERDWWTSEDGFSAVPNGPSIGIENRIGPTRYYNWYGRILPIPNDIHSMEYGHYLRRTRGYGKK